MNWWFFDVREYAKIRLEENLRKSGFIHPASPI
jgi:hypothetical protein